MSIAKPRVTALPRDPSCLVIFWEIPADDTAPRNDGETSASASASLALRIADTTFRLYDGTNANDIHDIPITGVADHLYVRVEGKSGRTLTVDLGYRTATGQWVTLARAKPAEMPRRSVAPARPPMWMTVTPTAAAVTAATTAAITADRSAPKAVTPLAAPPTPPTPSSPFGAHRRPKEKPLQRPIEDRQIKIVRPTTRRLPTKSTPATPTTAAQHSIHHGPTIGTEWLETTTEWPAELPPELTAANAIEKLTHRLLGRLGVHRWRESWRAGTRVFSAELGKAQVPWPRAVPLDRASHLELVVAAKRRVFRADDGRWMAMVGPWHIGIFAATDTTLAPRRLDAWSVTLTWTSESPIRDDEMRRVYGMIFGSPESPRPPAPEIPAHPPQTTPAVGFTVLPRDPHEFRPHTPAPTPAHAPPASVPASFGAENHELGGGASEQPASGAGRADIVGFIHRVLETAAAAAGGGPLDTPSSGELPMIATSMGRELMVGGASETNAISAESSAGVVLGAIPISNAPEKWAAIPSGISSEQFFGISSEQPHLDTSSSNISSSSSSEAHAEAPNWFRAVWLPALAAGASEQFAVPVSSEQFHQVGGASEIWAAHWMAGEFPAASENLITAPRESQIMPGSSEAFAFPAASENFLGASEAFMAASENFLGASEAFAFPGASEQFVGASAQFMLGRASEAEHGPGVVEVGGEKWVTLGSTQTPTADPGDASAAAEAHAPAWRHQPAGELPTIVAALAAGALVTPSEPQTATTTSSPSATVPAAASSAPPVAAAAAPVVVPSAPASSPAQPAAAAAVTSPLRAPSTTATTTPSAAPPLTSGAAPVAPASTTTSTSTTTTMGSPSSTLEFHPPATELSAANLMPELRQLLNGLGIASIVLSAVAAAVAVSAPIAALFVLVGALAAVLVMWRKRTEAGQAADDMPVPMIGLLMFAVATPFVVVLATGFTGVTAAVLSLLIVAAEIALIGPLLARHHSAPPPPPPHQPR